MDTHLSKILMTNSAETIQGFKWQLKAHTA